MRYLKIKDIGEIVSGSTPKTEKKEYWDGDVHWVTPKELGQLNGKYLSNTERKITKEGFNSCSTRLIPAGNVLFTSRAPIGHLAINDIEVCTNQGFKSIILKENFSSEYIYYALKYNVKKLQSLGTGSTFKELSKSKFETFSIPVPEFLSDQLHIAKLLSKAENLITQRKESIHLLDEFLKSTFAEMFGDPLRNQKKWSKRALNTVISGIDSGWSPVCLNKPRNNDSEWAILKLSSVTYKTFNPLENKLLDQSVKIKKEIVPKKGNLLFSRKNTYELVGATVYVFEDHEKLLLSDTIFRINYEVDKVNGFYLWFLFNDLAFRNVIQSLASGASGSMPNISKEKLNNLKIPIPPKELQDQFAKIVEKTESVKGQYQISLLELKNLYGNLSQKAFKGELHKTTQPLINEQKSQELEEKYFLKRKVLATYIINQSLNDPQFGDVKFEKILHLSEYFTIKRNLNQNYLQKAAGPYDNGFTIPFFKQIESSKWFLRTKKGAQYIFKPGSKHHSSTNTYDYFTDGELQGVDKLIAYFKQSDYRQPEIISTLYAVWNNRIIRQQPTTDELLKIDFLNWDSQKIKYKDRLDAALQWMRKVGLVPDGWGKVIEKPKSKNNGKK
jgi:restriction endonuclease S subunit